MIARFYSRPIRTSDLNRVRYPTRYCQSLFAGCSLWSRYLYAPTFHILHSFCMSLTGDYVWLFNTGITTPTPYTIFNTYIQCVFYACSFYSVHCTVYTACNLFIIQWTMNNVHIVHCVYKGVPCTNSSVYEI